MSSESEKWKFTRKVALAVFGVMVLLCLPAAFLCKPLLLLVYGKSFEAAVPAFLWLLPAIVMISTNAVFMNYFASIGNPMVTVYSPGVAAAVNVLLNLKLIPMLGIVGASLASVLAYALMFFFSLFYIWRRRQSDQPT
jgi:O-antigen/teichoic acid export membrane protein